MAINVQGNPNISLTPSGTQNVKIVSWDSAAPIPAGVNAIGAVSIIAGTATQAITGDVTLLAGTGTQNVLVVGQPIGISGTVTTIIGTATQVVAGAVSLLVGTATQAVGGTMSVIQIGTGAPWYQQNATAIAATGTGIIVMGIQSAATTSRGWAFTTSAGGHVFVDNSITMAGTVTVTGSGTNTIVASLPAGNQIIGTMSISGTQSNILVASIPAGNQIIGTAAVSSIATLATGTVSVIAIATTADNFGILHGGSMRYGTVSTNVNFVQIIASASGDTIVVTSAAGKSVVILSLLLNGDGANKATLCSSASAVPLIGPIMLATSGVGAVLPINQHGWQRTTTGQSLVINLASSGTVGGVLTYLACTTG